MTGSIPRGLLAGAFLLTLSGWASGAPPRHPPLWWKSEEVVKELRLTADQSARIEKIFQVPGRSCARSTTSRSPRSQTVPAHRRRHARRSRARAADRSRRDARANANKTRSLILAHAAVLTADQRVRSRRCRQARAPTGAYRPSRQGPGGIKPESESHKRPSF